MKSSRIIGFLGIWLVILAFLGIRPQVKQIVLIVSGVAVAFISFRDMARQKIESELKGEAQIETANSA